MREFLVKMAIFWGGLALWAVGVSILGRRTK